MCLDTEHISIFTGEYDLGPYNFHECVAFY